MVFFMVVHTSLFDVFNLRIFSDIYVTDRHCSYQFNIACVKKNQEVVSTERFYNSYLLFDSTYYLTQLFNRCGWIQFYCCIYLIIGNNQQKNVILGEIGAVLYIRYTLLYRHEQKFKSYAGVTDTAG